MNANFDENGFRLVFHGSGSMEDFEDNAAPSSTAQPATTRTMRDAHETGAIKLDATDISCFNASDSSMDMNLLSITADNDGRKPFDLNSSSRNASSGSWSADSSFRASLAKSIASKRRTKSNVAMERLPSQKHMCATEPTKDTSPSTRKKSHNTERRRSLTMLKSKRSTTPKAVHDVDRDAVIARRLISEHLAKRKARTRSDDSETKDSTEAEDSQDAPNPRPSTSHVSATTPMNEFNLGAAASVIASKVRNGSIIVPVKSRPRSRPDSRPKSRQRRNSTGRGRSHTHAETDRGETSAVVDGSASLSSPSSKNADSPISKQPRAKRTSHLC